MKRKQTKLYNRLEKILAKFEEGEYKGDTYNYRISLSQSSYFSKTKTKTIKLLEVFSSHFHIAVYGYGIGEDQITTLKYRQILEIACYELENNRVEE